MLLVTIGLARVSAAAETEPLALVTASGTHEFSVEIADTDPARAKGLMFRRSLGERQGMLFLYEEEQEITMWMRNTYISLDMIFIRGDGVVHSIARDTEPFSEALIASGGPAAAVLEVAAGTAGRIGLKPGDVVESMRFEP